MQSFFIDKDNRAKIKNLCIIFYCIHWLVAAPTWGMSSYVHPGLRQKPGNTPTAHTQYPVHYTLHAEAGKLTRKLATAKLILFNVHDTISYQYLSKQNQGHIFLSSFLATWEKQQIEFMNADVTGVEVDQKTVGNALVYRIVQLYDPIYLKTKKQLIFNIKFTSDPKSKAINFVKNLSNVTLFISGCPLNYAIVKSATDSCPLLN